MLGGLPGGAFCPASIVAPAATTPTAISSLYLCQNSMQDVSTPSERLFARNLRLIDLSSRLHQGRKPSSKHPLFRRVELAGGRRVSSRLPYESLYCKNV